MKRFFKITLKKRTRVLSQKELDSLLIAVKERNTFVKIIDKIVYSLRRPYIKLRRYNWSVEIYLKNKKYVINLYRKDKELEKEIFEANGKLKPFLLKEDIDELLAAINKKQ